MPDDDALWPDRFYVIGDAGSFYFDESHPDGFETAAAAAEWARTQTQWEYGTELDFSDGYTSIIALGADLIANEEAWEAWDGTGEWPNAPGVTNHAIALGLVDGPVVTRAAKTKVRARRGRRKKRDEKRDAFAENSSHADGHQSD